jgi:hypothetical protein
MASSANQVVQFVHNLDLPEPGPRFESVSTGADIAAELEASSGQALVAVGSQLAEFDPAVAAGVRGALANNLLLAQLAANKAASQSNDMATWYGKYNDTLQNTGWTLAEAEFQNQTIQNKNANVHEEIIPIITAMLGPQVAAVSMVVNVLRGLQNMNKDSPWITLFDRSSEHASGAKFQVSYVDLDAGGNPRIKAMYFGVLAERSVTQVLFFKFAGQRAEFRKASSTMSASVDLLNATKPKIASRVQEFIAEFVAKVEI